MPPSPSAERIAQELAAHQLVLEPGKRYEVKRVKPGGKNATTTAFKVIGFYESPTRGFMVEIEQDGRRFVALDAVKDAVELQERED